MGKHILSSVSFLLILALLLAGLSIIFQPKDNTDAAGMFNVTANGILAEPENTIDIVIIGDSEAYCGIIPMEIWKEAGITAYICGSSAQKMYEAEAFLRTALENQKPKLVILETLAIYSDYSRGDQLIDIMGEWVPILRYHDRWKRLHLSDFHIAPHYTNVLASKGHHYYTSVQAAASPNHMQAVSHAKHIPSKSLEHLTRIRQICQEHGAQLMLLSIPSTVNWNSEKHNGIAALAESMEIPYLDLNHMEAELGIDWTADTRDAGDHLNFFGAKKVSDYLSGYFSDMDLFTDKREDPEYDRWNSFLTDYRKEYLQ